MNRLANALDVQVAGMMMLLELHLNIGILRPDGVGLVKQQRPVNRQPDVVAEQLELVGRDNLPDGVLDPTQHSRAFLEPRADRASDMQANHSGIDGTGKKSSPTTRIKKERGDNQHHYASEHEPALRDAGCERTLVSFAQALGRIFRIDR